MNSTQYEAQVFLPVEHYLPHRGTMQLLDRLLAAGPEFAIAQVRVPRDSLFHQVQGVPGWVAIEYMAQTVAAWAGWNALQRQQSVKLGFLLGSRKFVALQPFIAPGSVLQVHVSCELMGDNGLGMFDCQVLDGEQVLATAKVSVFEPTDGRAYLSALDVKKEHTT